MATITTIKVAIFRVKDANPFLMLKRRLLWLPFRFIVRRPLGPRHQGRSAGLLFANPLLRF
jgi:hypothetical protein